MHSKYYLDVSVNLGALSRSPDISADDFKNHVMKSVKKLFGEVGNSEFIELISFDKSKQRGVFVCSSAFYVKLRAAITLTKKFEGFNCVFTVHKVSPSSLSLLADSRTYNHE